MRKSLPTILITTEILKCPSSQKDIVAKQVSQAHISSSSEKRHLTHLMHEFPIKVMSHHDLSFGLKNRSLNEHNKALILQSRGNSLGGLI